MCERHNFADVQLANGFAVSRSLRKDENWTDDGRQSPVPCFKSADHGFCTIQAAPACRSNSWTILSREEQLLANSMARGNSEMANPCNGRLKAKERAAMSVTSPYKKSLLKALVAAGLLAAFAIPAQAQSPAQQSGVKKTKIILDTDIGDDVDDAFALGLALESPELEIVGVTTAWGDTGLRARLVRRMLAETGQSQIQVAEGIVTESKSPFTQSRWAERGPAAPRMDAIDFLLAEIRRNPGELTLVAIGPLTNIGAAVERDRETFLKLQRVVLMGGSIRKGYGDSGYGPDHGPQAEYNIASDIPAARKLFLSGVPIFMMPLDSTQLKLDEVKRATLFSRGTRLTDLLTLLYHQWGQTTPTLFDAMAVAFVLEPRLCPVEKLHIEIDQQGFTRERQGTPNVSVCLESDSESFFRFLLPRLMSEPERKVAARRLKKSAAQ
jgi:inosine-uridine nucleoside N-ribohydrolase